MLKINEKNPLLVEVTRGGEVESLHRGAICVCDPSGKIVFQLGDVDVPIFPRSSVKALQAIYCFESGAADAFNLSDAEIACLCASHSGEVEHVHTISEMLKRAGVSEDDFECGGHWSTHHKIVLNQARKFATTPPAIYNNCSGKHAGFLLAAKHLGIDAKNYVKAEHEIQQQVKKIIFEMTETCSEGKVGTDGCSIPTYAVPLRLLATGFARLMQGQGVSEERGQICKRIVRACVGEPFYVAGTGRFCTDFMTAGGGEFFVKTGAEGVFCGGIVGENLGIALKCDDGANRASEVAMAEIICKLSKGKEAIKPFASKVLRNWNKIETGIVRAVF